MRRQMQGVPLTPPIFDDGTRCPLITDLFRRAPINRKILFPPSGEPRPVVRVVHCLLDRFYGATHTATSSSAGRITAIRAPSQTTAAQLGTQLTRVNVTPL